ncbi:hypothetical protein N9K16_02575 [Alphaproteobacteria bacterium]|nr:hypothetical protein [Alphaproteobacteria bacterium]
MDWDKIGCESEEVGLVTRGGFSVASDDQFLGQFLEGEAGTLVLLGNVSDSYWHQFSNSPEYLVGAPDPLDRWSRRVISKLSIDLDARALFPFDGPPYFPFQRWAAKAEPLAPSPLGLYISPEFGLWHAFRGALLFNCSFEVPTAATQSSPCLTCVDQPCLNTCPVGAFSVGGYDVNGCYSSISSDTERTCLGKGCQARLACPVGANYVYGEDQMRFLMAAFEMSRCESQTNPI